MARHFNKKAYIAQKINSFYRHKQRAELIPDNQNVYKPRILADARITIKLKGHPSMTFSTYKLPNGWTISPTLAGKKVQQVLLHSNL